MLSLLIKLYEERNARGASMKTKKVICYVLSLMIMSSFTGCEAVDSFKEEYNEVISSETTRYDYSETESEETIKQGTEEDLRKCYKAIVEADGDIDLEELADEMDLYYYSSYEYDHIFLTGENGSIISCSPASSYGKTPIESSYIVVSTPIYYYAKRNSDDYYFGSIKYYRNSSKPDYNGTGYQFFIDTKYRNSKLSSTDHWYPNVDSAFLKLDELLVSE